MVHNSTAFWTIIMIIPKLRVLPSIGPTGQHIPKSKVIKRICIIIAKPLSYVIYFSYQCTST